MSSETSLFGKHGYKCLYKEQSFEVWTDKGSYDAQCQAAAFFKVNKKNQYKITVVLCVKPCGESVVHTITN